MTAALTISISDIAFDPSDINEGAIAGYVRNMNHKKRPLRPALHVESANGKFSCLNADAANLRQAYEKRGDREVTCVVHGWADSQANMIEAIKHIRAKKNGVLPSVPVMMDDDPTIERKPEAPAPDDVAVWNAQHRAKNAHADRLAGLAITINGEHKEVVKSLRSAIAASMNAGDYLLEAKDLLDHGQWLSWLEENCKVKARTAQVYMRLAKHRKEIEAKAQRTAYLTIEDALTALTPPSTQAPPSPLLTPRAEPKPITEVQQHEITVPCVVEETPLTAHDEDVPEPCHPIPPLARQRGFLVRGKDAAQFARDDDLAGLTIADDKRAEMIAAAEDAIAAWSDALRNLTAA